MDVLFSSLSHTVQSLFKNPGVTRNIAATTILLFALFALRYIVNRTLRQLVPSPEFRRKWMVSTRNQALILFSIATILIWAGELRPFALSLVAVAAAIAIATKELILCLLGGIVRSSSRAFSIGDRIQVGTVRGDVIDINLLTTTIMEVGPGNIFHQATGKAVIIPNSLFLSTSVTNETFTETYVLHSFSVHLFVGEDLFKARQILLEAADEVCASYLERAKQHFMNFQRKLEWEAPSPDPRVSIQFPEPNHAVLLVRFPAPSGRRGRAEQAVLDLFLSKYQFRAAEMLVAPPALPLVDHGPR